MTGLVHWSLRHRAVTLLAAGLVVVTGGVAARRLDRELVPAIEAPYLAVVAAQPGAGPEAVDRDLTTSMEAVVRTTRGLRHVDSISVDGIALVAAEYEAGTAMADREREVRQRLAGLPLPAGVAAPAVARMAPASLPVSSLAVSGADIAAVERWVDLILRPAITALPGVSSVEKSGGNGRTVTVLTDPAKLRAVGYTSADVADALRAANLSVPAGGVDVEGAQLPVQVVSAATTLDELGSIPLGPSRIAPAPDAPPPAPPTIADVARISTQQTGAGATASRTDGRASIGLEVWKEQAANTVRIEHHIQSALAEHPPPPGVQVAEVMSQAPAVERAVAGVGRDAALGALAAAALVLLAFRRVRPALVAGLSIPLAVLVAFVFMQAGNVSLSILTIGALAVAVGRLIDSTVVVLDNIHRLLEAGAARADAIRRGTTEMVPCITAATVTTAAVFLPLAVAGGVAGAVLFEFAVTVTVALAASLLVAVTAVPALADLLLRAGPGAEPGRGVTAAFRPGLARALSHRRRVVAVAGVVLLAAGGAAARIGTDPFPAGGTRTLAVTLSAPPGASVSGTMDRLLPLEERLATLPGVERFTIVVGTPGSPAAAFRGAGSGGNAARVTVALEPGADPGRLAREIETLIRTFDLSGAVSGVRSGSAPADVVVRLTGPNGTDLSGAAAEAVTALAGVRGLAHVTSSAAADRLGVTVDVNRDRAVARGLDGEAVAAAVRGLLAPVPVSRAVIDGIERQVVVTADPAAARYGGDLRNMPVADGVLLGDVGEVASARIPIAVSRHDGVRSAEVRGVVTSADRRRVHAAATAAVRRLNLPDGVTASVGGSGAVEDAASEAMARALAVAVLLLLLALVVAFRNVPAPVSIMLALPLVAAGAVVGLLVTGREFGVPVTIGVFLAAGIMVANAIVLLELAERLQREGLTTWDALMAAAQARRRPVLTTAAVTTGAFLPAAVGLSDGAFLSAGLAAAVIGGMLSSALVTLVVLPVLYSLAVDLRFWVTGRRLVPARPVTVAVVGRPAATEGQARGDVREEEPAAANVAVTPKPAVKLPFRPSRPRRTEEPPPAPVDLRDRWGPPAPDSTGNGKEVGAGPVPVDRREAGESWLFEGTGWPEAR